MRSRAWYFHRGGYKVTLTPRPPWAALPKPIAGIPYDRKSANRLLGDVPDALKHHAQTSEMVTFLEKKCLELGSPIAQVFMRPFSRPWVVLIDGRESQDIMARRGREFDRSEFFGDLLVSLFPMNQVSMRTNDQWRHNRRLMADAMSPRFLNNIAAKEIHQNTLDLIDLWRQKIRVANGHVIDVGQDIKYCTVDTIWATAFGTAVDACKSQCEYLSTLPAMSPALKSPDTVTNIPVHGLSKVYSALETISISSEIPMNSAFGRWHHWLAIKLYPSIRHAVALRDQLIEARLRQAWKTFGEAVVDPSKREAEIRCVVDLVVERESAMAHKQGKEPDKYSQVLKDELGGFLNAGFETTSSSVNWGLKYLTKHQDVQQKLRQSLRQAFSRSSTEGQQPAAKEIAESNVPYLDAFMEEVLRHSSIISTNIRVATTDAPVLGRIVPKGTRIHNLSAS
ncbi:hypothetical protein M409DRAFT_70014 [Zasmidium cellare ATCC 36951]|uniref:Cytochrome P450 n=1 Tax=Zasmidium cellare ATCC 36951 TaxID=1080233 RepID=A0A6A6C599_ZASCE|nr:uncharacterized protein M409DRAFT_70014 [Zasmidium cellare ATCC 36951]KAF2160919.1 hypothetical protein M409DRAFT_70014 [Zasmidium cellare ATCC 36951]